MRRRLLLVPLVLVLGCSSTPSLTPEAQPTPGAIPITIVCGPLASTPVDCAAAVEAAVRIKDPALVWASIRIDPPGTTCTPETSPCRAPTIIVRFLDADSSVAADVPLVGSGTSWISLAAIR